MADETKTDETVKPADDIKVDDKLPDPPKPIVAAAPARTIGNKLQPPPPSVTKDEVVKEVMPKEKPLESADAKEAADLHGKISTIVREHGGNESNIPHNHVYWGLLNQFRTLVNKKKV